jgi:hypothetical protein
LLLHFLRCSLALPVAGILISCGHGGQSTPANSEAPATSSAPAVAERTAPLKGGDDVGRFLAGMPGAERSPFKDLEKDPGWIAHSKELDRAWKRFEETRVPPMAEFQKAELAGPPVDGTNAFYPFGGPDILTAQIFFPHAPTYVLVGLEPAGTLPDRKHITRKSLDTELVHVRETIASVLSRSFFVTKQMDKQFRGQVADGLLPTMLMFLVRTHHTVTGYSYVRLDEHGRVIDRDAVYKAPGRIGNKGVEIQFEDDGDKSKHKLYYFSVNLDNAHLNEDEPFLKFFDGLGRVSTFFKSTSYMTHRNEFSVINKKVIEQSDTVLQDDSGLPYHYFDKASWNVQLFGGYDKPYGSFRYLQQKDLKKAFTETDVKELKFRIGYGYSRIQSNLLLAKRKK